MATHLRGEPKQSKPSGSREQEAHLSVGRTAAALDHAIAEALKPHGITPTQYSVLRILRGAGPGGLCRNEVSGRMVARVPDVTRLLDRMEAVGLIQRCRDEEDRRFVTTRISQEGLRLVDELHEPMMALHQRHFAGLEKKEIKKLIRLLERVRRNVGE